MLIIPAIDLQDGCVIRLVQGKFNKKVYSREPLKVAGHWLKQGAKILHIVDLDGAITGKPKNLDIVKEMAVNLAIPIQCGGGIRDLVTIKALLKSGIQRVVLGTRAAQDRAFLKNAWDEFGERIIVSIDGRYNTVLVKGWQDSLRAGSLLRFARLLKDTGFKQVIYTDTLKDGTLSGPNLAALKKLLKETELEIIASGGISSLADIRRLKKLENKGLSGVIIGKALYEGRFTLKEALKLA
jgi:phosphoribosylformimino-5-aminoimidazole carboxamide ribotide isomerase